MFQTILVPLDGSARAEEILPYVEELAVARQSKVVLLQVVEPATYAVGPYETRPHVDEEMAANAYRGATSYLDALAGRLRTNGLEVTSRVEYGAIVKTILGVAESSKADLVAMASHGRTGLGRVFYGSVAAGVLHGANRPLLLIRTADGS